MPLYMWDDSFSVGNERIDNQHKKLISLINELFDSMKQGTANEKLNDIILNLVEYTKYHFSDEEKYFDLGKYHKSSIHKEEHEYFIKRIFEFKEAVDSGKTKIIDHTSPISVDLWKLLKDWLVNHIKIRDKHYAATLKPTTFINNDNK